MRPYMGLHHRNIDDLMKAGTPLPVGHPSVDAFFELSMDLHFVPSDCPGTVSAIHPSVDAAIARGELPPASHPAVDSVLRAWMPSDHPNVDDLMAAGTALPLGHPPMDPWLCWGGPLASSHTIVQYGHPEVDALLRDGEKLPCNHPAIDPLIRSYLPEGHGNCDDYIRAGTLIPDWHPNIDDYIQERSFISSGILLATFVLVIFVCLVLWRYLNMWFTCTSKSNARRKSFVAVAAEEAVDITKAASNETEITILPNGTEVVARANSFECFELGGGEADAADPSPYIQYLKESADETPMPSPLPRRNIMLHDSENRNSRHRDDTLFDFPEYRDMPIPAQSGSSELIERLGEDALDGKNGDKLSSASYLTRLCHIVNHTRVPHFDWSLGHVLTVAAYLALNYICLVLSPDQHFGRGWGSLAACNTMLLVIPACRNSVLGLFLGMPFDRVVVFHRFIGRFVLLCGCIHGFYYVDFHSCMRYEFLTGAGALFCGLVIFFTSLNYIRRNYFNVFFWSHYSFVGYLTLAYFHVPKAKPFIILGAGMYVIDKILRYIWILWPQRTVVFQPKGDSIAQVSLRDILHMLLTGSYCHSMLLF
jgi:hypothetical protein